MRVTLSRWVAFVLVVLVAATGCPWKNSSSDPDKDPNRTGGTTGGSGAPGLPPTPATAPAYREIVSVPFLTDEDAKKLASEFKEEFGYYDKVADCAGIHRVAFAPGGRTVFAGGLERMNRTSASGTKYSSYRMSIKLFALPSGTPDGVLVGEWSSTERSLDEIKCKGIAVSPDGKRLWSARKVWDLSNKKEPVAVSVTGDPRYHPNGKCVVSHTTGATAYHLNTISTIDAESGLAVELTTYPDGKNPHGTTVRKTGWGDLISASGIDFSPDGGWLARSPYGGELVLDPLKPGEKSFQIPLPKDEWNLPEPLLFTAGGRLLVGLCQREYGPLEKTRPSKVRAWSLSDRKLLWEVEVPPHASYLAVSPDGHWVALACGDKIVRLLSTTTGKEMLTLKGHSSAVLAVAFSNDSKLLAAADTDTVRVWRAGD